MPPCLTLNIIRYGSRVKWVYPGKGKAPSSTPWCSSCGKGAFGSLSTTVANLFSLVKLWTIRCSLVQVYSLTVQSYARVKRIWQSSSVIINPQTGNGVERSLEWIERVVDVVPERDVQRILRFSKVDVRPLKRAVGFFEADQFWVSTGRDFKHHKMRCSW